jgi:hypothetical protein
MADKEEHEFISKESLAKSDKYYENLARSADMTRIMTGQLRENNSFLNANSEQARAYLGAVRDITKEYDKQSDLLEKVYEGEANQDQTKSALDSANKKVKALEKQYNFMLKSGNLDEKALSSMKGQVDEAQKFGKRAEFAHKTAQRGNTTFVKGLDTAATISKKLGFEKLAPQLNKSSKALRGMKAQGLGFSKQMGGLLKTLGKGGFLGIFVAIGAAIFKAMVDVNNQITALGKGLGVSQDKAREMRRNMSQVAGATKDVAVTTEKIMKSFTALNQAFGLAATVFRSDLLVTATKMTEKMGMTGEATANLVKLTQATGGNLEQNLKSQIGAVKSAEAEFGTRLDIKKVLEDTAKVGKQIQTQLGANPALIAKAVASARLLGMELNNVAAAGKTLLDFESSISAELEAELLMGKQLNLERARLAALTGDYETLSKEISKEAGSLYEFTKLNVLQQDAYAKALGMNADQLSDILINRENILSLQQQARAEGDQETLQRLEQLSAQQKFNMALDKMKSLLVDAVAYLEASGFLDWMANLAGDFTGFAASNTTGAGGMPARIGSGIVTENGRIIETDPKDVYMAMTRQEFSDAGKSSGAKGVDMNGITSAIQKGMAMANVTAQIGMFENTGAFNHATNNLNLENLERI